MVTISHLTKKAIQNKPYVHECLEKGLININVLAELIQPEIEKELGIVKVSAISMAIRRFIEKENLGYKQIIKKYNPEILIKSNLFELSVIRSHELYKKIISLFDIVDFDFGNTLNIIHGNNEILIISNDIYKVQFLKILKSERIKLIKENISSISIKIPKENIENPGFYYSITRALTLNNINIIDIVNTQTEATFILEDKNISKAYDLLKSELKLQSYGKNP
jgi:aspartokinase